MFDGATMTKEGTKQVRQDKFVFTEATAEQNDFLSDWVIVDMAMPPAMEMKNSLSDEDDPNLVRIREKLDSIQESLNKEMPDIDTMPGKETHQKEIDETNIEIISKYNELVADCDKISEDPLVEDEIKERVEEIRKNVIEERDELENSVARYRRILSGAENKESVRKRTYLDALRFQRGEYYDLDEKDAEYETGGGGTSMLYIIKKKDEPKLYFKKDEKNPEDDLEVIASKCAAHYKLPKGLAEKISTFLAEDNAQQDRTTKYPLYYALVKDVVFELQNEEYATNSTDIKLNQSTKYKSVNALIRAYNTASSEHKLEIRNWIVEFGVKYNTKNVATNGAKVRPGNNINRRNVATSRMASLMGLNDLVAYSSVATIKQGGKIYSGSAMREAEDSIKKDSARYELNAMSMLMKLQVFDIICGQVDRKTDNYTRQKNGKGNVQTICAIDNDMAFGEISYLECPRQINALNYAMIPRELIKTIKELDLNKVKLAMMDLLTKDEIDALIKRILDMREDIDATEEDYQNLSKDERSILMNPGIGPAWAMLTYAVSDKKTVEDDTLMEQQRIPAKQLYRALLKSPVIKSVDMSQFQLLVNLHDYMYLLDD